MFDWRRDSLSVLARGVVLLRNIVQDTRNTVHYSVLHCLLIRTPFLADWAKSSRDRLLSLHDYLGRYVYKHVRFKGFFPARLFDDGVFPFLFPFLFRHHLLLAFFHVCISPSLCVDLGTISILCPNSAPPFHVFAHPRNSRYQLNTSAGETMAHPLISHYGLACRLVLKQRLHNPSKALFN